MKTPNFWLLLLLTIALKQIPYVTIPFNWLESYFHEISHGLAALISGGSIVQIQLFTNGAGLCTTLGGSAFLIAFSGYAGAVAWGVLIYKIADLKSNYSKLFSYFILALLVISCVLWVRDFLTLFICTLLIVLFLLSVKISHFQLLPLSLKIIALMVLLNSFESPLYLIDGRGIGDGSALSELTFVPEFIWIGLWTAFGAFSIYCLSKAKQVKRVKK